MAVHRLIVRTLLAGATLAAALPAAIPASAAPATPGPNDHAPNANDRAPNAASKLVLGVDGGKGPGGSRGATLNCHPTSGSHPEPERACTQITLAQGKFDRLAPKASGTACTLEYQPVTAHARGTWQGKPVDYRETFSNRCDMINRTGAVFDF